MLGGNIDLMLAVKSTFGGQVSAGKFRLVAGHVARAESRIPARPHRSHPWYPATT
jgi:hypothetical protein